MIVKERKRPIFIEKLEALLRRTPPGHRMYPHIQDSYGRHLAGFKGEESLDYPLSFLPAKRYFIYHGLRLQGENYPFQIDTLLISRCFLMILEVKNLSGTLFFDHHFHQLIRSKDGTEEGFPDPLLQVKRQEMQLKDWLAAEKFPDIPILSLIIISNPCSVIRTSPENQQISKKVIHGNFLPEKIKQHETAFKDVKWTEKDVKRSIRRLKKKESAVDEMILERFEMKKEELIRGVQCSECSVVPMTRIYGNWSCMSCGCTCKSAHVSAIKDYTLLVSAVFRNRDITSFLNIKDPALTTRLIRSSGLHSVGRSKGAVYTFPIDE